MGKRLTGGYKIIPISVDLALASESIEIAGLYASIKSTKKRIVLSGLKINGKLQNDIAVKVDEDDNGLVISDVYGYDLAISEDDELTVSEHETLSVVANPTLAGTEADLTGLEVDGVKYKAVSVVANPTLAGTEADLTGLEVNGVKYKAPSGGSKLYKHSFSLTGVIVDGETTTSATVNIIFISQSETALTNSAGFNSAYQSILRAYVLVSNGIQSEILYKRNNAMPDYQRSRIVYFGEAGSIIFEYSSSGITDTVTEL